MLDSDADTEYHVCGTAKIIADDLAFMTFNEPERCTFELRDGDLLVCEGGEVGRSALWDESMGERYYQKAIHRVRPLKDANGRYLISRGSSKKP